VASATGARVVVGVHGLVAAGSRATPTSPQATTTAVAAEAGVVVVAVAAATTSSGPTE